MNLLLDINIVVDLLARRSPHVLPAAEAVREAQQRDDNLALYVGSVQTLVYVLYSELRRFPPEQIQAGTNQERLALAKQKLHRFSQRCIWIPAAVEQGIGIFAEDDVEDAQLIRAARGAENIRILTRDESLLSSASDVALSVSDYLKQ